MIYQTGTIATTAGQTKIKGTGTRWKDNLAGISEGCPISYLINNVVYMNTVLSVNSDTEINLTYPVPVAASAAKYQIATFVLDSMSDGVRKMLANQQYIGYFLRNMDAWLTQDGIVEIKTPTGETVKLESIIALKKLIDGKLSLTGGVINKDGEALAIKNANEKQALFYALRGKDNLLRGFIGCPSDTDRIALVNSKTNKALTLTEAGAITYDGKNIVLVGDYGLGATYTQQLIKITDYSSAVNQTLGFIYNDSGAIQAPSAWGGGIRFGRDPKASSSILYSPDWNTRLFLSAGLANGKMSDWVEFYSTGNTTKDSNGNLKAASPVIKVYSDHVELNDESEGVELEKLGTGRYKLKGTLGMNSDASWGGIHGGLVVPNGINNLPLVWADFDVLPDGDIIIETRYRKHTLHPRLEAQRLMTYPEFLDENNVEREDYDYCDIPNGHWIDVRVNMPSDSIYNQKLAEAERLAKIEAERVAKEEAEKAAREEAERLEEESKQEQASKLEE
ncbi:hypothetical protein [Providencia alcalifaciens]|uniref:phage tail fiber protein n=1 Tax=Providencia alcalifaciens TaxID=126385 RepID=UPI000D9030C8|nr:hypothetical protein [Providencia alcalifaciens]MTC26409.1 hypothetical protein [Providencia alcalifaciens]SPY67997.1 Uncharacterised protein [Providencia alcalifaciens]